MKLAASLALAAMLCITCTAAALTESRSPVTAVDLTQATNIEGGAAASNCGINVQNGFRSCGFVSACNPSKCADIPVYLFLSNGGALQIVNSNVDCRTCVNNGSVCSTQSVPNNVIPATCN